MKRQAQHWKTHLLSAEEISPIPVTLACTEKPGLEGDGHSLQQCSLDLNPWISIMQQRCRTRKGSILCSALILETSPTQHSLSSATKSKVQGMQTALGRVTSPWAISASHGHTVFESSSHHFFLHVEWVLEGQEMGLRHPAPSVNE